MTNSLKSAFETARDEVSTHSAGGTPFLIAYGATFLLTAIAARFFSIETTGIIAMFQGGVALPLALWLERRMGGKRMSADNPLRALSAQLAMAQGLALPAWIVIYTVEPALLPFVLASFGGVHFVPYAWLHRTRLYIALAVLLVMGSFLLLLQLGSEAFGPTLLYTGLLYWLTAPLVYRHAARTMQER